MRYASLRQGLVGAWCPSVSGPYGYRLPDLSGYGNHGTLTNMDPGSDWVASGGKGALDFDGSNDWVSTSRSGLQLGKRAVSVWFCTNKVYAFANYGALLAFGKNSSGNAFLVTFGNDPNFGSSGFGISQWGDGFGVTGFNDGLWHHCYALSIPNPGNEHLSATYYLYLDGLLKASKSMSTFYDGGNVTIGNGFGSLYYKDQLDDIRIYNRALTEQEIRLLASERGIGLKPERQRNRYSLPVTTSSRNRSSRFLGFPS